MLEREIRENYWILLKLSFTYYAQVTGRKSKINEISLR